MAEFNQCLKPGAKEMTSDRRVAEALNRIADAIQANAQATELLARATSGEFDQQGDSDDLPALDLSGRPLR